MLGMKKHACVGCAWLIRNLLQVNDGNTEAVVVCSPPHMRSKMTISALEVGDSQIVPSAVVRKIGAFIDQSLNMQDHVQQLCRTASLHLKSIDQIRHILDAKTAETLVHAFITSHSGNALLLGLPDSLLGRLQSIQNTAARIVTRTGKYEHIKNVLERLHWLPVKSRVDYKIILLTFKALHGVAPVYLSNLLTLYEQMNQPSRALRSSGVMLLHLE
jgi:hypothetical protein